MANADAEHIEKLKACILRAPLLTAHNLPRECMDPGCVTDHGGLLFLRPECHPRAPLKGVIELTKGIAAFFCGECFDPVVAIKIAQAPEA